MSGNICIFERTEKKYLLTSEKYSALMAKISQRLCPDRYHESYVNNIYLDTDSFLIIRNSIDAVSYKEKLRIRCYGEVTESGKAFFELKKKYKGVVYKRRISAPLGKITDHLERGTPIEDSQIMREIARAEEFYGGIHPAIYLSYHRVAYRGKTEKTLRLTFDDDILYRFEDVDMLKGRFGTPLIPSDTKILEIKCDGAVPLWLAHALDEEGIYPTKFSKCGIAYRKTVLGEKI